jgi:hypothetical protein
MPILGGLKRILLVLSIVTLLAACGRGSSAYRHIMALPYSEWNSYAASLPIEKRLDLQQEIFDRTGPNPQMTISGSFSSQPLETYRAIHNRIERGYRSIAFLGVIYEIDRAPNFEICSQSDRRVVQSYLSQIPTYPRHEKFEPDFFTC